MGPHAKCNPGTGKCAPCTPGKDDPSCTQVQNACDEECVKQSLSKCNHDTGKCEHCADNSTAPGCVLTGACEATCGHVPPPPVSTYKCDWEHAEPQCVADKDATMNKTECAQTCEEPSFAKCNYANNTCEKCDHTKDKDCIYTMDYCKVEQ